MMAAIQSLCLLVLLSSFCNGQITLQVKMSKDVVHVGGNVTITCEVWRPNKLRDRVIIKTFKRYGNEEYEIGRNSAMNPTFVETGRYFQSIQFHWNSDSAWTIAELRIANVQPSDSAVFGCILPDYRAEVHKKLIVYSPIQRMQLTMGDPMGNEFKHRAHGQTLQLPEGKIQTVICWVKGGYPAPKVVVTVESQDITNQFQLRQDLLTEGEVPEQQVLQYKTSLLNKAFNITKALDDKVLRCAATIPGSGFEELSESFKIKISENEPTNEVLEDLLKI